MALVGSVAIWQLGSGGDTVPRWCGVLLPARSSHSPRYIPPQFEANPALYRPWRGLDPHLTWRFTRSFTGLLLRLSFSA